MKGKSKIEERMDAARKEWDAKTDTYKLEISKGVVRDLMIENESLKSTITKLRRKLQAATPHRGR